VGRTVLSFLAGPDRAPVEGRNLTYPPSRLFNPIILLISTSQETVFNFDSLFFFVDSEAVLRHAARRKRTLAPERADKLHRLASRY
jgi:hypothetical protein